MQTLSLNLLDSLSEETSLMEACIDKLTGIYSGLSLDFNSPTFGVLQSMDLEQVGKRLEEAVQDLPGEINSEQEQYDAYESIAIQMLDSEHANYGDGTLEVYLQAYLDDLRRRLDLD